ncbi:hypothetical protein VSP10_08545 [Myroides odoratimimus]|uniref:Uncharacterized protein n=1 Tax=Myroides odoratimimus CIP 101113 TaxID=883154 RepID=A0AAV3F636_9FLAO|nr:hypothetical protein [Myroides odoratimimus]EHO14014.1 hypothetical protein HMPREF9715_01088 [Myroides odoratimimus CIP 101113]MEC4052839.1 hypothetical protein [Myroides odoratimimus]
MIMRQMQLNRITALILFLISVLGYGQGGPASDALIINRQLLSGYDIVKELNKQEKDTLFTRYFNSINAVDSVSTWDRVVKYTGKSLKDNQYLLMTKTYKLDIETRKLVKEEESKRTLLDKKGKKQVYIRKQFLKGGLVEEYKSDKGKETISCYDKNGAKLNDKGCLLYTYSKFPRHKFEAFYEDVKQRIQNHLYTSTGRVPSYILLNIEADYLSKKWFVTFSFPEDYKVSNHLYSGLVINTLNALNSLKIEEYHFNKDLYGNFYNRSYTIPFTFIAHHG